MRPGYVRALWCAAAFFLIGMYIVVSILWLAGWDPVYDWNIITAVGALTTGPIGFLLGLAVVLSERFSAPLGLLAEGTRAVAEGDFTRRQPVVSTDELGILAW